MSVNPADILEYLERRRISVWAVAIRMEVDPAHLRRVLTGRRTGSQALLKLAMETAEAMRPRTRHHNREDTDRLIEAAAHMFFLKRGGFESAIFADPNQMGLYGPVRKRPCPARKEEQCPR